MDSASSLTMGSPAVHLLQKAARILQQATSHRMSLPDASDMLEYGPVDGLRVYREELAKFLSREYKDIVSSDDLFPTCGATHGLYLLASQYFGPGDVVFVEELSFFLAVDMLSKDLKMKAVPVPMDEGGIKTKDLQRLVEETLGKKNKESEMPFRAMVYLIPVHQNPTGSCLPDDRCSEVVDIARKHNLLVVCDDVYNLLPLNDVQHRRLYSYDKTSDPSCDGHVVSNGTFSKIFGPGVRMGWIEGPKCVLEKLRQSNYSWSGGGQNHCMSGVIASVLQLGLQDQLIKEAREFYQKNARRLCQILEDQLPASVKFTKPQGGYFVWVELPTFVQAEDILDLCKNDGVEFFLGKLFNPERKFGNCVRLCFSYLPHHELVQHVEKFAQCVCTVMENQATVEE